MEFSAVDRGSASFKRRPAVTARGAHFYRIGIKPLDSSSGLTRDRKFGQLGSGRGKKLAVEMPIN